MPSIVQQEARHDAVDISQKWDGYISDRHGHQRLKPLVMVDNNVRMKGMDMRDQLAQSYSSFWKSKWTTKVFYKLIVMAVVNSFSVHKALGRIWLNGPSERGSFMSSSTEHIIREPNLGEGCLQEGNNVHTQAKKRNEPFVATAKWHFANTVVLRPIITLKIMNIHK